MRAAVLPSSTRVLRCAAWAPAHLSRTPPPPCSGEVTVEVAVAIVVAAAAAAAVDSGGEGARGRERGRRGGQRGYQQRASSEWHPRLAESTAHRPSTSIHRRLAPACARQTRQPSGEDRHRTKSQKAGTAKSIWCLSVFRPTTPYRSPAASQPGGKGCHLQCHARPRRPPILSSSLSTLGGDCSTPTPHQRRQLWRRLLPAWSCL